MRQYDTRTGLEVMDRRACLALLAGEEVGRVGLLEGAGPLILPTNYALDGEDIIIRTFSGTKLDLAHGSPVCFEVDSFDRESRSGWSVVVRGRLEVVSPREQERWDRVHDLVDPWAQGDHPHVLAIVSNTITGRKVAPGSQS